MQKFVPATRYGKPIMVVNGAWLADVRTRAGVNLQELADRIGCGQPFLGDVEQGLRRCPVNVLAAYEFLLESCCV